MRGGSSQLLFLLSLIFGLYQINTAANFFNIPAFPDTLNNILLFIGGILLVLGGINYLRLGYRNSRRPYYR
ncbi:MAG: hypothetical protein AABW50_01810 [Nanoarchaeota archaeon]